MTRYVTQMHEAWLTFEAIGTAALPRLRVVFAMLAGLAPLHSERLLARGGPPVDLDGPSFYDISSYGALRDRRDGSLRRPKQLLYGSDRPVVEPRGRRGRRATARQRRLVGRPPPLARHQRAPRHSAARRARLRAIASIRAAS